MERPPALRVALLLVTALVTAVAIVPAAWAQRPIVGLDGAVSVIEDIRRPRLAFAADGAFAVAAEVISQEANETQPVQKVAVRRFTAAGAPVGPWHVFVGESCSGVDIWTSDYMWHAELAFRPDGILAVLMQHSGRFHIGTDDVGSAEATLGAIDPAGQRLDLHSSSSCTQYKFVFPGGGRQDRPRMAMAPNGGLILTADGFFEGSDFRNVAVRVLDADLNTLLEQAIPHADPLSQQAFHRSPDVVTNGDLGLSVWQRCPFIDPQGNASECDIGAQFFASPISPAPPTVGGNVTVTAGDPPGTISVLPSAAMNASGASVVTWVDTRTTPTGDIFAQRFDAAGQRVGGNIQVSATEGVIYARPEVAMLTDGQFLIAWTDSSSLGFQARGRRYDAAGQPLGPPFRFVQEPGVQGGYPSVAAVGSGFQAVWLAGRTGEIPGIYTSHAGQILPDAPPPAPAALAFLPNYPNPFREVTRLAFTLPEAGNVTLVVLDVLGREVARVVDGPMPAGRHDVPLDGSSLSAGAYVCRLTAGDVTATRLLVRVR